MHKSTNITKPSVFVVIFSDEHDGDLTSLVAFVGSSEANAIEFMENNDDYASENINWHWTLQEIVVDEMDVLENLKSIVHYDTMGNVAEIVSF